MVLSPRDYVERHFWYGCGKLKERMVELKSEIMKMRSEVAAAGGEIIPHPDTYLAKHPPSSKSLERVTDDDAYWYGCAKCRWQLQVHERILRDATQRLQRIKRENRESVLDRSLAASPSSRLQTMLQYSLHS